MSEDLPEALCDKPTSALPGACQIVVTYLPQNENAESADGLISHYNGTTSDRLPGVITRYAL